MGIKENADGLGSSLKRKVVGKPCCQRRLSLRCCFLFLFLLCLSLILILSSYQLCCPLAWRTTSLPSGYEWFLNWANQGPDIFHFLLDHPDVCHKVSPFLVLMVPVNPKNIAARNAIRQTWGNLSLVQGKVVLTLFMLGLSPEPNATEIEEENERHHDLIQSNFVDTYLNLTVKTMVIMEWLATRCPETPYAMKIDSDMFLNLDNLITMLTGQRILKRDYLTGRVITGSPVIRQTNSSWYVPEVLYPVPEYPPYVQGMGYVFSGDLPEKLVRASKTIPMFNIEDAFVGTCMEKLRLSPTSPPRPSQFRTYIKGFNQCALSKCITYILNSTQQLLDYWREVQKPRPHCKENALL